MNQTNLLQKLAPLGVAAFGAISITGIAIEPAHAQEILGTLTWEDGTDSFFDEVDFDDPNDIFDVEFLNPQIPTSLAFISGASGQFLDPLDFVPGTTEPLLEVPFGQFEIIQQAVSGNPDIARYQNTNNIEFKFQDGEIFTLNSGNIFLGTRNGGVDFELDEEFAEQGEWFIPNEGNFKSDEIVFTFGQIQDAPDGEYGISADKIDGRVPEPATILGLLTVGGLGLGLKRKKQS